jgi:hypothetical protein
LSVACGKLRALEQLLVDLNTTGREVIVMGVDTSPWE